MERNRLESTQFRKKGKNITKKKGKAEKNKSEGEERDINAWTLFAFSLQHIVRTYDGRQSCLWSAEQGEQFMRHINNSRPRKQKAKKRKS